MCSDFREEGYLILLPFYFPLKPYICNKTNNMEENSKKSYGFWDSLKEHPIRTVVVVALVCDCIASLFSRD